LLQAVVVERGGVLAFCLHFRPAKFSFQKKLQVPQENAKKYPTVGAS
jgi:hypothetical protein